MISRGPVQPQLLCDSVIAIFLQMSPIFPPRIESMALAGLPYCSTEQYQANPKLKSAASIFLLEKKWTKPKTPLVWASVQS